MGYRQYQLLAGKTYLTTWLKDDERLQEGVDITLKSIPGIQWTITEVYETVLKEHPSKQWKVGGLE